MRIPDSKVAEIASAANIVDVVSDYLHLKKSGKDYRGVCPFHGDKDPSLYVSPQKQIFYCFGCATGGNVFSFLMKIENISFAESVKRLSDRYGVALAYEVGRSERPDEKEGVLKVLTQAGDYFLKRLEDAPEGRSYLNGRGISQEWINHLGLGYAPDSWDGLTEHLRRIGADPASSVSAGLIRPRPTGGHYDYFRSRIMIPIRDLGQGVVAFGGRILGEGEPKYLNSPESSVFHKKELLFGLDSARESIRREANVVLVEGYFDQISLRIRGLENVVAPLGTSLGKEQVKLLRRFTHSVTLVFDGDEAGVRAVKRAIPLFLAEGLDAKCLILKEYKDPDEAVNKVGIQGFRRMLDTAVEVVDFLLDHVEAQYDLKTLHGRNMAADECLPILREIADSKEGDYLLERFSYRLRTRENRLRTMLGSAYRRVRQDPVQRPQEKRKLFDFPAEERNILRGMLTREDFIGRVVESNVVKDFREPVLKLLAEKMIDFGRRRGAFDPVGFARSLEDDGLASIVAGWLQPNDEEDDMRPGVDGDLLLEQSLERVLMRRLEKRKDEIKERLRHCEVGEEEYNHLGKELLDIARRLKNDRVRAGAGPV
ncbi:MAG: DNA primase [Pseudomonadota bacterium]